MITGPLAEGLFIKTLLLVHSFCKFLLLFYSFNDRRPPAETANQTTITLSLFLHIAVSAANKNESELTVNFATAQRSLCQKISQDDGDNWQLYFNL